LSSRNKWFKLEAIVTLRRKTLRPRAMARYESVPVRPNHDRLGEIGDPALAIRVLRVEESVWAKAPIDQFAALGDQVRVVDGVEQPIRQLTEDQVWCNLLSLLHRKRQEILLPEQLQVRLAVADRPGYGWEGQLQVATTDAIDRLVLRRERRVA
jgi:hypothetical protein